MKLKTFVEFTLSNDQYTSMFYVKVVQAPLVRMYKLLR